MSAKISLCMIVGNVEQYIDRCLSSFAQLADEICVVRAIGNQKPDGTLDIAAKKFSARTAEYRNAKKHGHWPHVDNFAAARQQSFDMATGDYCFWCDSDDVLESGAELVRELAERGGYPAFVFPYRIFARGLTVNRVRMMTRGSGKWICQVHEDYKFAIEPAQAIQDDRVVITHMPFFDQKKDSHERNLRILRAIPEAEMSTGLLYHMQTELCVSGDINGAIKVARKLLERPDLGTPEKYELFLNFAQVAKDPNEKNAFLHQAYQADPRRREALGLLANHAMNFQRPDLALAYARQMIATEIPNKTDWNDRSAAYGWVGYDIYAQALRANGMFDAAEAVRQKVIADAGGVRIALVHATRGRPEQAALARKMWLDLAENPDQIEHIFVFDDDDKESVWLTRMHHLKLPAGGGCVAAWNHGALATIAPVIVQMSDDWLPPARWDALIWERIGDVNKPSVLAISDGTRKDALLCMAICTRQYFALDWFLFHPSFTGVYSDNWFTELAYSRGAVIEAGDLVFQHNHAIFGKAKMDKTYVEQNSPARYEEGLAIYNRVKQQNDWTSVPGFFNYWNFYELIARGLKDGDTIAEVGVWLGRSIIFMAELLKRQGKNVKLIAVDHFKGESNQREHEATVRLCGGNLRAAFEANIERCGVTDMITIMDGDSAAIAAQVPDGSLAFCFIDAAHDYESVKRDITAWRGKVRPGGVLAGHDADWPEVAKAVTELLPKAQIVGSVWVTVI